MTVSELRGWGRHELRPLSELPFQIPEATINLEVDVLLKHAAGFSASELLLAADAILPGQMLESFKKSIARRRLFEPIAYIVGTKEFFGIDFMVNREVLIPRPETELIVEEVLRRFHRELPAFFLVDVGTGSGAIVLSILSELRKLYGVDFLGRGRTVATDISPEALAVAQANATRLGLERYVSFIRQDLICDLPAAKADEVELIVSNPPYIPDEDILPPDVDNFEPRVALRAGEKGLDIISQLLEAGAPRLMAGGSLYLEIGYGQLDAVKSLLQKNALSLEAVYKDLQGIDRVLHIGGI